MSKGGVGGAGLYKSKNGGCKSAREPPALGLEDAKVPGVRFGVKRLK